MKVFSFCVYWVNIFLFSLYYFLQNLNNSLIKIINFRYIDCLKFIDILCKFCYTVCIILKKGVTGMTRITILVGSGKPLKSDAIQSGFQTQFDAPVEVVQFDVPSGVHRQPKNRQVFKGVRNRIARLEEIAKHSNLVVDYIVACEAGILKMHDGHFYNVQVVGIMKANTREIVFGTSQGLRLPPNTIKSILHTSISEVFNQTLKTKRGLNVLTNGYIERGKLITDATIMALASRRWQEMSVHKQ